MIPNDPRHFCRDEVPAHYAYAADDCQAIRAIVNQRILGPFGEHEVPTYPTVPPPLFERQKFVQRRYNLLSFQELAPVTLIALYYGGRLVWVKTREV